MPSIEWYDFVILLFTFAFGIYCMLYVVYNIFVCACSSLCCYRRKHKSKLLFSPVFVSLSFIKDILYWSSKKNILFHRLSPVFFCRKMLYFIYLFISSLYLCSTHLSFSISKREYDSLIQFSYKLVFWLRNVRCNIHPFASGHVAKEVLQVFML